MSSAEGSEEKYWYNLRTGQVEFGMITAAADRAGPYDTAEEAANALELMRRRSEAWAEDDAHEDDWPER